MDKSHFIVHVNSIGEIIISITIISFDIYSGEIVSKLKESINPTEQQKKLGHIFDWDELLNLYNEKDLDDKIHEWKTINYNPLDDVLDKISTYIKFNSEKKQLCIWGNGPSLHQNKIINLYSKSNRTKPWQSSDERCTKTLESITSIKEQEKIKKLINFIPNDDISKLLYQIKLINKQYTQ